jgi:hypothetical protein
LFDYAFPDSAATPAYLNKIIYEYETYPDDTTLYHAVITEYNASLKNLETAMREWDTAMEKWYNSIATNPENAKLDIFK